MCDIDAFDPNDIFHDRNNESPSETLEDFDSDESAHAKVHYVYDAAAERTKERISHLNLLCDPMLQLLIRLSRSEEAEARWYP